MTKTAPQQIRIVRGVSEKNDLFAVEVHPTYIIRKKQTKRNIAWLKTAAASWLFTGPPRRNRSRQRSAGFGTRRTPIQLTPTIPNYFVKQEVELKDRTAANRPSICLFLVK